MSNSTTGAEARLFVRRALEIAADQSRFETRQKTYPLLTKLGCLPSDLTDIVFNDDPSVFHSLAFRMATYDSERIFSRWEQLLSQACECDGWESEYSNWNSEQDHWAIKWNRFNQFLWMLQCCEYFVEKGGDVSFPYSNSTAKPDIHVRYGDGSKRFVECYYFTKWWGTEQLVEDLLFAVDKKLYVERRHNLIYDTNPFANDHDGAVTKVLAELGKHLKPDRLADLKQQACIKTPVEVCELGDFVVLLDGPGDYSPRANRHGDPSASWPVYRNEILRNKADCNGLPDHKPNLLLVNCLGIDFQISMNGGTRVCKLPSSLDEVWFCTCGIDAKIETSRRLCERKPSP